MKRSYLKWLILAILMVTIFSSGVYEPVDGQITNLKVTANPTTLQAGFNTTVLITIINDFEPIYDMDVAISFPQSQVTTISPVVIGTSNIKFDKVDIGKNVSVGHGTILHGCTIGDNCIIGMQSVILDNAKIDSWVLIGAGAVVPSNVTIPTKSLALGVPAKVIRQLTTSDLRHIEENAKTYSRLAAAYQKRRT